MEIIRKHLAQEKFITFEFLTQKIVFNIFKILYKFLILK